MWMILEKKTIAELCDDIAEVYQLSCTEVTVEEIYTSKPFVKIAKNVREAGNTLTDGELLALIIKFYTEEIRNQ